MTFEPIWTPGEPELPHAALELADREVGALHRERAEAREARRVRGHDPGDVVVQAPREVERRVRLRPVAEHDRHRREHLHVDARRVAFGQPRLDVPAVALDLAEQRNRSTIMRARPRRVMLEPDEPLASRHLPEVGQPLGKDVGVDVDLQQVRRRAQAASASPCRTSCRCGSSRRRRTGRRSAGNPFRRSGA